MGNDPVVPGGSCDRISKAGDHSIAVASTYLWTTGDFGCVLHEPSPNKEEEPVVVGKGE